MQCQQHEVDYQPNKYTVLLYSPLPGINYLVYCIFLLIWIQLLYIIYHTSNVKVSMVFWTEWQNTWKKEMWMEGKSMAEQGGSDGTGDDFQQLKHHYETGSSQRHLKLQKD